MMGFLLGMIAGAFALIGVAILLADRDQYNDGVVAFWMMLCGAVIVLCAYGYFLGLR